MWKKTKGKKQVENFNNTSVLLPSQFTCNFFVSLAPHIVFSLVFFSHCFFPTVFFPGFFPSVSHLTSHSLISVSTAPSPHIPIYPRSCVLCFVYLPEDRPCHETFSCKTQKSVFEFRSRTIIYMQTEAEEGTNMFEMKRSLKLVVLQGVLFFLSPNHLF